MFDTIGRRLATAWTVTALLLIPGCVPNECDIDFQYAIGTASYEISWRVPSTECDLSESDIVDSTISYERDGSAFSIWVPGEFEVGTFNVEISYTDTTGITYRSDRYGLPNAGCTATLSSVEFVDWVSDDHYRIRGVASCALPLYDRDFFNGDAVPNQLRLTGATFNIYAGSMGY